jgi:3-oxoacyl-[acyl-carrier-protein] synthase III
MRISTTLAVKAGVKGMQVRAVFCRHWREGGLVDFGLVSFGSALGRVTPVADVAGEYTDQIGLVLSRGYRNVLRCPPEVGVTDLAADAAGQALEAAGAQACDLDLVVLAVTDLTEYLYWDAASSLAHRLGAGKAEAVLLTQACTGGVLSLETVAGKLATHPDYRLALVIAASRCCEAYWNRLETQPLVFSDGAVAAVAKRGHPRLRWLATEAITEGEYADFYRLDAGGAAAPFGSSAGDGPGPRVRGGWEVMEHFGHDADLLRRFSEHLDEQTERVLRRACARVGTEVGALGKVILLNDNQTAMMSVAARMGISPSRTNLELAAEYGHLGAADQLFCLGRYHGRGELEPGTRLALVSRGRGMHWACSLIEV